MKEDMNKTARDVIVDGVRQFLKTANSTFERNGIYLNSVKFKRAEDGTLTDILLNYEDREGGDE